jgi:hypothetical protein
VVAPQGTYDTIKQSRISRAYSFEPEGYMCLTSGDNMKYLKILPLMLMSGLSIASDDTLTDDQLTRVRTLLDNQVSITVDLRQARVMDSLRKQAIVDHWKPYRVFSMIETLEFYQSWLAEPICKVLLVVAQNKDMSLKDCIRAAVLLQSAFKSIIVDKWKLLDSKQFDANVSSESLCAVDMQKPNDEIGNRLNAITNAHAATTHDCDWELDERICIMNALGEVSHINMDEVVKTYQTIIQGNKGYAYAHADIIKILAEVDTVEHEGVRSAYQIISQRFGCRFQLHLLRDVEESYPYLSLEEWEAKLDSITIRDEAVEFDLHNIIPIVKSLAKAQVDLSCTAKVVSRYFCNYSLSGVGRLLKMFAEKDDARMPQVARAAMLLFNHDTSMIHFMSIVNAFYELSAEDIDPIAKAIVIIKTKEYPNRDLYNGAYRDLMQALLSLPDANVIPIAKKVAQLAKDRSFDEDKEVQLVKELSGSAINKVIV